MNKSSIRLAEAHRAGNEHDCRVREALAARPPRPAVTEEGREESGKALLAMAQAYERDPRPPMMHEANPDRPKFPTLREWVRAPARAPRVVAIITRAREHRPAGTRRSASSSTTSSSDPGDDPSDEHHRRGELRHISEILADELNRIADQLRARGGVG